MRRRTIIFGFVGAAIGAQRAAVALQNAMPVIGFLHPNSADSSARFVEAFGRGLAEIGYHEGKNVTIRYRWGDGHFDRMASLALDLVRLPVDIIATPGSTAAALAAKTATTTIPIVFGIPDDAVKLGLVASIPHPGGNATGFNFQTVELVAKRLELFHELLPEAKRVAVLVNPTNANNADDTVDAVQAAARGMGMRIQRVGASSSSEIETAFAAFSQNRPDALFVGPDSFFNSERAQIASLAAGAAIPASFSVRDYVEAGGLISYGVSIEEVDRNVGIYTGRILNGESPAELPVQQPTKFELVINLKTAKALGLTIPESFLARADEVIE